MDSKAEYTLLQLNLAHVAKLKQSSDPLLRTTVQVKIREVSPKRIKWHVANIMLDS